METGNDVLTRFRLPFRICGCGCVGWGFTRGAVTQRSVPRLS
jgi:hypothetical protein